MRRRLAGPPTTTRAPETPRTTTTGVRAVPDELEELRLEIAALRKGLEATRVRVKALEGEVRTLRSRGSDLNDVADDDWLQLKSFDKIRRQTKTASAPLPRTTDPLADAQAALKRLREQPDDKQAADALEMALQRLKDQTRSRSQPPPQTERGR